MWSDPEGDKLGFSVSARGAGYIFGEDVCEKFLQENNMTRVYRAH
jgi:diadenosine tetraphosphatase ApaH/serine/threonine PP2A family protein phosphatase